MAAVERRRTSRRRGTVVGAGALESPLARAGLPGGVTLSRLRRIGVTTVRDLLFHLPRRYDDLREIRGFRAILDEAPEEPVSARAVVVDVRVEPTIRRRVQRTVATLRDADGQEATATWFGRRFVERRLGPGARIVLTGKVRIRGWSLDFQGPEFGPDEPGALHAGRIVPVYGLTAGVTNPALRRAMRAALDAYGPACTDYLPPAIRRTVGLVGLSRALEEAHFPSTFEARDAALRRLAFDELLALEIGMIARDRQRRPETAPSILTDDDRLEEAISAVEAVIGSRILARRARAGDQAAQQPSGPPGDDAAATTGMRADNSPAPRSTPTRESTPPPVSASRLTTDQRAAILAIRRDLVSTRPMLRLLQGDVGSGKTAVAALALAIVADSGRQGALLAPTDLLARQHAVTLRAFLEPLGHDVVLLTGSLPATERRASLAAVGPEEASPEVAGILPFGDPPDPRVPRSAGGERGGGARPAAALVPGGTPGILRSTGRVVVGTHALLEPSVRFRNLALVVIDEQHRFGVEQRDLLASKGTTPHVLLMTATPIPRTLGQVFYADLDVSDLHSVPEGRVRTVTGIRSFSQLMSRDRGSQRGVYPLIVHEVAAGHRAFVVVPLVEEDESAGAVAVGEAAARLERELPEAARLVGVEVPAGLAIGTVHGQMKAAERDRTMEAFRTGEISVLVGTTVIEVGVDVPEATVMVVLNADRFGLAQLHQLRGRVGRGDAQSYCVLVTDTADEVALRRLQALVETTDGFALAEADLELRRPGDLLGILQSGLPPLRVASLVGPEDRELAAVARSHAHRLLDADGRLLPDADLLRVEIERGWLARVGAGEALARPGEPEATGPGREPAEAQDEGRTRARRRGNA